MIKKETIKLTTPIENIGFITEAYTKRLKKLNIETVEDLINHLPTRYDNLSGITNIQEIKDNPFKFLKQPVTIKGTASNKSNRSTFRNGRPFYITEAEIEDEQGDTIKCIWFNQPYTFKTLSENEYFFIAGKISIKSKEAIFSSPELEVYKDNKTPMHTARIISIYHETYGLSSKWLRYAIDKILKQVTSQITEPIPNHLLQKYDLLERERAFKQIHFPEDIQTSEKAKYRFSFEEMFTLQLAIQRYRSQIDDNIAPEIKPNILLIKKVINNLPFTLTDSQKKVIWRIIQDTEKITPMNRLLEGDVGSGKTIVACIAALNTIKSKYQVALMSPTEVLAQQHYNTIKEICDKHKITVSLITRTKKDDIKANLLIGTHALIQKKINIDNLGLLIIDEQHKFGVAQRANLIKKSSNKKPHLLSMTATPIPRTLALTLYGDLDISILDQMPKKRKPIITEYTPERDRKKALQKAYEEIDKGHQVFIIVPLIEESEAIKTKNAIQEYKKLSKEDFKNYKVGLIHGQIKQKEKDEIMEKFRNNEINVLVSTSVIEVGVDIPNATVMIIEGTERFGLSQLHQFRGRIGRSNLQSYCFLFTTNEFTAEKTQKRISAFLKAKNGYELANYDMKMRGAGDMYGTQQSGMSNVLLESLTDLKLIEATREEAKQLLFQDTEIKQNPLLNQEVKKLEAKLHLE